MDLCSVRMPLLESEARAVRQQIRHFPQPHDPINGLLAVRDQQRRAAPEFARPLPRDRLESARLKPRRVYASGGRLGDEPTMYASDSAELERNRVLPARPSSRNARVLVGCGSAIPGSRIVIVDPESKKLCPPDVIGEIWVAGPSVAEGYWNRDEETAYTFHAYLSDSDDGPFLRTGDLGFVQDGELFVTGRLKDLIIIDGRNVYPHDIEKTAERSHSAIRPGCCAAFSIDLPEERLIVAAELDRRYHSLFRQSSKKPLLHARTPFCEIDDVVRVIRRAVAEEHDVRAHSVVLLKAGSLPRTPSGKLQRHVCRSSYLDGTLAGLSNALDTSEIRQQRLAAHV